MARREFITFSVCNHFWEPSFDYSLILVFSGRLWCERLELNQWQHDYRSCALPTELRSRIYRGIVAIPHALVFWRLVLPTLTNTSLLNGRGVRTICNAIVYAFWFCKTSLSFAAERKLASTNVRNWFQRYPYYAQLHFVLSFFSLRIHKLTSDLRRVSGAVRFELTRLPSLYRLERSPCLSGLPRYRKYLMFLFYNHIIK